MIRQIFGRNQFYDLKLKHYNGNRVPIKYFVPKNPKIIFRFLIFDAESTDVKTSTIEIPKKRLNPTIRTSK